MPSFKLNENVFIVEVPNGTPQIRVKKCPASRDESTFVLEANRWLEIWVQAGAVPDDGVFHAEWRDNSPCIRAMLEPQPTVIAALSGFLKYGNGPAEKMEFFIGTLDVRFDCLGTTVGNRNETAVSVDRFLLNTSHVFLQFDDGALSVCYTGDGHTLLTGRVMRGLMQLTDLDIRP